MHSEKRGTRLSRSRIVIGASAALLAMAFAFPPVAMAGSTNSTSAGEHSAATPGGDGNWVTAWSASPQGPDTLGKFGIELLSGTTQIGAIQNVVPPPTAFSNQTIRQVMYLHHGGSAVRIQLANDFGRGDTTFPSVTVGRRAGTTGANVEGAVVPVTFGGRTSVTIPKGKRVLSDPVPLPTKALDHLVLSIFVPTGQGAATVHGSSMQTFFTGTGDRTKQSDSTGYAQSGIVANRFTSTLTTASYYATGVQVEGKQGDKTIVALGDSITDGFLSDGNTDGRYPDVLARRLNANPATANLSVANQAISGGRVTADGIGPSTGKRLQADVLDQPNLGGVIFMQGINDFGTAVLQGPSVPAQDVIAAYKQLADRVHAKGVPIYIGTLNPAGNLARPVPYGVYSTPDNVAKRNQVNQWIRTEGPKVFDGVIDFDKVIRDPLIPDWYALRYDALDNLHPNQTGYKLMGDTVPQAYLDALARS